MAAGGLRRTPGPAAFEARRRAFVRRLLTWYRAHRRDLPWRHTTDPYRVLVSEVMLQQTQVDRVLPKYREFLRRYPSIEALAAASVDTVRETWYPLGYNIRPVRLHAIARTVVQEYDGKVPDDRAALLGLKGIGPYTAGAVLSFAYGRRAPLVDTNVRRVLQRVFYGIPKDAGSPQRDARLWRLAEALLPRRATYDFNQGMMELGATVCVARMPRCAICPLRPLCRAYPHFARETRASKPRGASGRRAARRAAASSRAAVRRTSRTGRGG